MWEKSFRSNCEILLRSKRICNNAHNKFWFCYKNGMEIVGLETYYMKNNDEKFYKNAKLCSELHSH
jgi:hypothetical protein